MEPNQPIQAETVTPKPTGSTGAIVVIVIIIALIVAGAYYTWKDRTAEIQGNEENVQSLEEQGDSTEPTAIEEDLQAESPDEFDEDFDAAFTEIDAAFEAE